MVAAFEVSGIAGMLLTGWLTDRVFGAAARGVRVLHAGGRLAVLLFWKLPVESKLGSTAWLRLAGCAIYGPQALVGITVANLATKRAAATAIGLTGLFGYASTVLSGWGLGTLVEARGWDAGFAGMVALAGVGTLLFAAAWPAQAHGYRLNQAK
jgi:OPA family glycerol-3-phosphate transporter-like MFS transporter/OPA family sugar phosphate sensor protein UhpC-like MFS transporter